MTDFKYDPQRNAAYNAAYDQRQLELTGEIRVAAPTEHWRDCHAAGMAAVTYARADAQHLIDTYCDDAPPAGAIERLMTQAAGKFDRIGEPGCGELQDELDALIYG